jgi:hypothetical protein
MPKMRPFLFSGALQNSSTRNGAVEPVEVAPSEERSERIEEAPKEGRPSGDGRLVDRRGAGLSENRCSGILRLYCRIEMPTTSYGEDTRIRVNTRRQGLVRSPDGSCGKNYKG